MIKHPALRVADVRDIQPAALSVLYQDLNEWAVLLPFERLITDFEIVGSYARGVAELHSDLDINISTGTDDQRYEAIRLARANRAQFRQAIIRLRGAWNKYGLRIDVALQHPAVKLLAAKSCYSLAEMRFYGTEKRRMDVNYQTGVATERIITRVRTPKYSISAIDPNTGDQVPFDPAVHDPWLSIVPNYRRLYGAKFQEFGYTAETQHMRGL